MNTEEKTSEQESTLLSSSLCSRSCFLMPVCEKPGVIKLSSSETDCYCHKIVPEGQKFCLSCSHPANCPIPGTLSLELCECQDFVPTALARTSVDEGHEKQGEQPAYAPNDYYSEFCSKNDLQQSSEILQPPILYPPPHLQDNTPQSIDELKASVTGLIEKPRKLPECKFIEYRFEIKASNTSLERDPCDRPPVRPGISLTMEANDHRFCVNPNDCKHTRVSLHQTPPGERQSPPQRECQSPPQQEYPSPPKFSLPPECPPSQEYPASPPPPPPESCPYRPPCQGSCKQ